MPAWLLQTALTVALGLLGAWRAGFYGFLYGWLAGGDPLDGCGEPREITGFLAVTLPKRYPARNRPPAGIAPTPAGTSFPFLAQCRRPPGNARRAGGLPQSPTRRAPAIHAFRRRLTARGFRRSSSRA